MAPARLDNSLGRLTSLSDNTATLESYTYLGLGTVVVVAALKAVGNRIKVPLPDMLLALVLASVLAWACGWSEPGPGVPARLPSCPIS